MRASRFLIKFGFVAVLVLAASCSRHQDADLVAFPVLVQSPAPDSVRVTTTDNIEFGMRWFVGDPSLVQFYRVYGLNPLSGMPDSIGSTTLDTFTVISLIPGPILGVASVSTGNVESNITFGSTPAP